MIRARDLGLPFEGVTGPYNAITDVDGCQVGHKTLISGDGPLIRGRGPVRTGVTAILPLGRNINPVFAAWYALNGNGEMTGTTWIEESGFLDGPIMITNTHSVGVVHAATIRWLLEQDFLEGRALHPMFHLPVVAETYDGQLNDINGMHVTTEHTYSALSSAASGPVAEGNVGGGTGMICHRFKGGIGTSSRVVAVGENSRYTVGVLVQANYGLRDRLTILGVPVGRAISNLMPHDPTKQQEPAVDDAGSIIVAVATDAPLLPHQLKRLARRVPLGMALLGSFGGHRSGDIFVAFSTANAGADSEEIRPLNMLVNDHMNPLFEATIQATEEAIINALVAAKTMTGINGYTVYALPHDRLKDVMAKYNRLQ